MDGFSLEGSFVAVLTSLVFKGTQEVILAPRHLSFAALGVFFIKHQIAHSHHNKRQERVKIWAALPILHENFLLQKLYETKNDVGKTILIKVDSFQKIDWRNNKSIELF